MRLTCFAIGCIALAYVSGFASAATKDLGNGFSDHGVAAPISNHRGTVATVDGDGRNVLLMWLMDHRGGYCLLMIDAKTGKAQQFPVPFTPGNSPYSSILSSGNKFYTLFNNYFLEFDPVKREFTFSSKTPTSEMAMGMTEDDQGTIWSVAFPQSGVVSYNPKTKAFKDYGNVYEQTWSQYPRFVAADDTGWIYFGLGNTATQIVALEPATGKATPMLSESERKQPGMAYVYRDLDGKVYGQSMRGATEPWYEFYKGKVRKLDKHDTVKPKRIITDSQALFQNVFPDGSKVRGCDLVNRKLVTEDAKGKNVRELSFDYESDGAITMSAAAAPDGTMCGGTAFPMRCFSYDPKTDKLTSRAAHGQWNTVARRGDRYFAGGYGGGFLLEWDPSKPWVSTVKGKPECNPAYLTDADPTIHRPTKLLPLADGKTLVLAGTPDYGYTGGGLMFWDGEKQSSLVLKDTDLIPDQSAETVIELPGNKLLVGTTTSPGTGGQKKATEALMYLLDMGSKKIEWQAAVIPGTQEYTDTCMGPDGLVYGIADSKVFFVFDPAKRAVVHETQLEPEFSRTTNQQGPRVFVTSPAGEIYILLVKGIAKVDPKAYKISMVAQSPVPLDSGGGDWMDGRIYFLSGSHLCSYLVKR
jgi:hypothetical protein